MLVCGCQLPLYQRLGGKPLQRLDDNRITLRIIVIMSLGSCVWHLAQNKADVMLLHSGLPDDGAVHGNFESLAHVSFGR